MPAAPTATAGHTGVAGTFARADPTRDLACVMLANQML
jgi:CubicO group peptidase (beta-lactamase class C family)